MESIELSKAYNPKDFESRIYDEWEKSGSFKPASDTSSAKDKIYSVVIPPPNVTGVLHIGHALNNTLQDIVVRYHRMAGDDTLWLTGTDHAGIATQNVVEKQLKKEGTSRREIGREEFLKRTWALKEHHHDIITKQQRALGNSTDWGRERFTMDSGLSSAVRKVFVTLFERGLLYKGQYLVNWCKRCGTALSDDEVEHTDDKGKMYHIYYTFCDGETLPDESALVTECGDDKKDGDKAKPSALDIQNRRIEIATTRPETLLGDTAVAVNPDDERYKAIVGKWLNLPLTGRKIKIIADPFVDMAFGTGVVKITPAHDPNDYACSKRNGLEIINILNGDGTLNENCPEKYRGMTTEKARDAVIADLEAAGLFKESEDIKHNVGHCYRCNTVIEPYLSEQWFVKMEPLAKKALGAWERGEIEFFPRKWENTYKYWLNNIKDWCISRQLWWGHRIPAWTCQKCGKLIVAEKDPEVCPSCGAAKEQLVQDPDVLDTWFSSWLWPFSTLGWPAQTSDFERFFPTSALITAYDIIFFWVSRMIMASLEFTGKAPFHDIYIHGLVRDKQGRKMSKSLGNGMDPFDIINTYGSDALKFTLCFMCAQGQDILIDKESFKFGSRFCNKIWNASRYLLGNIGGRNIVNVADSDLAVADHWIYKKLNDAIKNVRAALDGYRYNDAASAVMEYFWNEFCDWYIEATKVVFRDGTDAQKDIQSTVLLNLLEEALRLLHPFVPFLTEEIYAKLPIKELLEARDGGNKVLPTIKTYGLLITSAFPTENSKREDVEATAHFEALKGIIAAARQLKLTCNIAPSTKVNIVVKTDLHPATSEVETVKLMGGCSEAKFIDAKDATIQKGIGSVGDGFEVFLLLDEGVDKAKLSEHFQKEIAAANKSIEYSTRKLSPAFLAHANAGVIEAEKAKIEDGKRKVALLQSYIAAIGC